jgi:hypothetical protein
MSDMIKVNLYHEYFSAGRVGHPLATASGSVTILATLNAVRESPHVDSTFGLTTCGMLAKSRYRGIVLWLNDRFEVLLR